MGLGPPQQYLVKYNNYQLPGYAQSEAFDSIMNIADHYGAYIDGSWSEETGLANKVLTLEMLVWETDYLTCKQQIELASTYLRSFRGGFANLYVQYSDKHYSAMVKSIKVDKQVPSSVRTLNYTVEFECRPWLIGETLYTISSDTNEVGRTLEDGGWTPTIITSTGAVTIVGTTADGQNTGTIIVADSISGLVIDTEAYTATAGGVNKNASITTKDYRMYVGPGRTTFSVTGGSASISYYDRWYI
jgi:phage-related protein